jgi:hypothetical protein
MIAVAVVDFLLKMIASSGSNDCGHFEIIKIKVICKI